MKNSFLTALALTLALTVPGARPAHAQTAQLSKGEQLPWSQTASKEDQDAAAELLQAGNALMKRYSYAKAEAVYLQALKRWDHPGLHYNLALALRPLDRPVEAYAHFERAIANDGAALGAEKYADAIEQKADLEKRLTWVELISDNPTASVSMAGQPIVLKEGHYRGLVRPGPVALLAVQRGYQTRQWQVDLSPGQTQTVHLKLYKEGELVEYAHRWAPWKSLTVLAMGAGLSTGGGLLYWQARSRYQAFDHQVLECANSQASHGCTKPDLALRRRQLGTLQTASFATLATGGAALFTGAALVFFNRAQPHPIDADEFERRQGWVVTPMLGGAERGVLVTVQH
jgi:tetratricopeptide (TPR) repeat protein